MSAFEPTSNENPPSETVEAIIKEYEGELLRGSKRDPIEHLEIIKEGGVGYHRTLVHNASSDFVFYGELSDNVIYHLLFYGGGYRLSEFYKKGCEVPLLQALSFYNKEGDLILDTIFRKELDGLK